MSFAIRTRHLALGITALSVTAASVLAVVQPAEAATAKAGATCAKAGAKSGALVCTKKGSKLVWATASAATTATTAAATASSGAAAAPTDGVEGAWKASTKSVVGYRVKETLLGQTTEGVGRTSSISGSMTITGTKATDVALTADLTTLKSDDNRRDGQVQGRLLDTAKFPTAMLKTTEPIDFGKVPADQEVVTAKAKAAFTLRGVTKNVELSVSARRNGATIEVIGTLPVTFADFGIPNPSNAVATVGDTGTLEFAVVFTR